MRVEKEGMFGLAIAITWRLPDSGGGEEEGEEGEGVDDPAKLWMLPQPGQSGAQLHAGCGEPLLAHCGDDGDAQLARMLKKTRWKALE